MNDSFAMSGSTYVSLDTLAGDKIVHALPVEQLATESYPDAGQFRIS
jgi:hypothetical protein